MDEPKLKVGDELAFLEWSHYAIYTIDKITPSGRIKCGRYELDPDLRVRGRGRGMGAPYRAELVTDNIRNAVFRRRLLERITAWTPTRWGELPTETLEKVVALVEVKP